MAPQEGFVPMGSPGGATLEGVKSLIPVAGDSPGMF